MQNSHISALSTSLNRQFDLGLEVRTHANGLCLYICFYLSSVDFEALPHIVPKERFEHNRTIHVSELHDDIAIHDEVESILAAMQDNDTAVFFCANEQHLSHALSFLNFHIDIE